MFIELKAKLIYNVLRIVSIETTNDVLLYFLNFLF